MICVMYFDGVVNVYDNGARVVKISLDCNLLNQTAIRLANKIVQYEACSYGLEVVAKMKINKLNIYGDLMLIIYKVKGERQTKDNKLRILMRQNLHI